MNLVRTFRTHHKLLYHIVFVTKYRKKILTKEMVKDINDIINRLSIKLDIKVIELNSEEDHIHLLIETIPKTRSLDRIVNVIKASTSKILRYKYSDIKKVLYGTNIGLWSKGYYVGTVGDVDIKRTIEYIKNQKEIK